MPDVPDKIVAFLGIAFGLLLNELFELGRWLAQRLIRWSAHRLDDPQEAVRYEEEWLANLQQVPGKLTPLFHTIFVVLMVPRMRRELKPVKAVKRRSRPGLGYSVGGGLGASVGAELAARLSVALDHGLAIALGRGMIAGLVAGLVYGLLVGLMAGMEAGVIAGLVVGLVYALGHTLVSGLTHMLNRAASRR